MNNVITTFSERRKVYLSLDGKEAFLAQQFRNARQLKNQQTQQRCDERETRRLRDEYSPDGAA